MKKVQKITSNEKIKKKVSKKTKAAIISLIALTVASIIHFKRANNSCLMAQGCGKVVKLRKL